MQSIPRCDTKQEIEYIREQVSSGDAAARRQSANLSLAKAATRCDGVTRSTVLKWEQGKSEPRGRNIRAYYRFLRSLGESS